MSERRDVPWRFHTWKGVFGQSRFDRTSVYNRHGDEVATCRWEPDAEFIVVLVNTATPEPTP